MTPTEIATLKKHLKLLATYPNFVYFPGKSPDVVGTMVFELYKLEDEAKRRVTALRASHGTMYASGTATWGPDKKKPVLTLEATGTGVTKIEKDLSLLKLKVPAVDGARLANVAPSDTPPGTTTVPTVTLDLSTATQGKELGFGSFGRVFEIDGVNGPKGEPLVGKSFFGHAHELDAKVKKEAEVYAKAGTHPNIVSSFGVQKLGGSKVMVMEGLPGGRVDVAADTLQKKRAAGEISEAEFWGATQAMMLDTLRGLAHLESVGLQHNDIKGDNVMIGKDGTAKLIDLGELSEAGQTAKSGHLAYVAPEKAEAKAKGSSVQDSFSAGQLTHQVVSGTPLAPGGTEKSNRNQIFAGFSRLRDEIGKGRRARVLDPIAPTKDGAAKGHGKTTAGYDSVYVKFLEELLNPDETLRLSPSEALKHPFFTDSLISQDAGRAVLRKALGLPEPTPTTPVTPPTPPPGLDASRTAVTSLLAKKDWKKRVAAVGKTVETVSKIGKKVREEVVKGKRSAKAGAAALDAPLKTLRDTLDGLGTEADDLTTAARNFSAALPKKPTSTKQDTADRKLLTSVEGTAGKVTHARGALRDAVMALESWQAGILKGDAPASQSAGTTAKKHVREVLKKEAPGWQKAYEAATTALEAAAPVLTRLSEAATPKAAKAALGAPALDSTRDALKARRDEVAPLYVDATDALKELRDVISGKSKEDAAHRADVEKKLEIGVAALHRNLGAAQRRLDAALLQIKAAREA